MFSQKNIVAFITLAFKTCQRERERAVKMMKHVQGMERKAFAFEYQLSNNDIEFLLVPQPELFV